MNERMLFEIFKNAISAEKDAQRLYKTGAELAGEGTQLSALFKELEKQENGHEDTLMGQYAIFKEKAGCS